MGNIKKLLTRSAAALAVAGGLFFSIEAMTAEPAASTGGTAATPTAAAASSSLATAETDKITVPLWPQAATSLPESQPVPAAFNLGAIEGIAPELLSGVTAKGYARRVAVEDESIGQVLVVSVAKKDKEAKIAGEGLAAQFDAAETSELFPEKTLEVTGSKAALVAALKALNEKDEEEEDKVVKDTTSENATSSGGSNDEASSYTTPSSNWSSKTEETDTVSVSTTTDGCSIRIDTAQGLAIVQNKTQTLTNGAVTEESECSDSEVSFPLKQSYLSCPDVVDIAAMTAWPQYTTYYINDSGETRTVSECTQDQENPFTIAEDEGQCTVFLDFNTHQAVPRAALIYTNRSGAQIQARGCDTSTKSAALPMTESTAACSIRHDFEGGKSYQLSMWTYIRDGVTYQAAPCADTDTTYPHETVYTNSAGGYVCEPITNLTNKTVTLQSRKQITVGGVSSFITDCTPDTTSQAILATAEGCMNPASWTHDLSAGVSYGQERFYYTKASGSPVYVTDCQTSDVTYAHDLTITGYQNHDDQLYAYPLMTVTIDVNGSPYTVVSSQVLAGAAQFSYILASTADVPNGQSTYEGCNAYRETSKTQIWTRPDGTEYQKAIGEGTPQGPVDVCSETVIDSRQMQSGITCTLGPWSCTGNGQDQTCYQSATAQYYSATVNKTQFKNVEMGTVVSTSCAFSGTWNAAIGSGIPSAAEQSVYCPSINNSHTSGVTRETQTLFVPPCPF